MRKHSLFILALLAAAPVALAENFAECLLDKLPGVQNDPAAGAAYGLCRDKFPGLFVGVPQGVARGFFAKFDSGGECTLAVGRDTAGRRAAYLIASACRKLYDEPWGEHDKIAPTQ